MTRLGFELLVILGIVLIIVAIFVPWKKLNKKSSCNEANINETDLKSVTSKDKKSEMKKDRDN